MLSLSLSAGMTSAMAAEQQQWRPSFAGTPGGMPVMPMQPMMPPGFGDPRFRPVPQGAFMPPPRPPMPIYPGRPFVSVQGQYAGPAAAAPAFTKQYAWRPAEQPLVAHRPQSARHSYQPAAYYPAPPAPPAFMMPQGPYGAPMGYGYGPQAIGFMPPPPMPFPPPPGVMPGAFPSVPYAGIPGMGMPGMGMPSPQGYPAWAAQPYPGMAPAGFPQAGRWFPGWPGMTPQNWPSFGYGRPGQTAFGRNGLETGLPLAGLF